jgi:hypothetical protein
MPRVANALNLNEFSIDVRMFAIVVSAKKFQEIYLQLDYAQEGNKEKFISSLKECLQQSMLNFCIFSSEYYFAF